MTSDMSVMPGYWAGDRDGDQNYGYAPTRKALRLARVTERHIRLAPPACRCAVCDARREFPETDLVTLTGYLLRDFICVTITCGLVGVGGFFAGGPPPIYALQRDAEGMSPSEERSAARALAGVMFGGEPASEPAGESWSLFFGTTCRAFGEGESGEVLGDGSLGDDGDPISRAEAGNCVDRYPLTGPGGNGWWISEGE